jgi:hypothetical protein
MIRTRHWPILAAAFVVGLPLTASAQSGAALTADIGAVPNDAIMMAHLRVAELWQTEPLRELRDMVARAGPRAFETYTKRFPISPALVERVTMFVLPGPGDRPEVVPPPLVVVALKKAIDQANLVEFVMPGAKPDKVGTYDVFVDERNHVCIYAIDQHTVLVSAPESVKAYLSRAKAAAGPMLEVKNRMMNNHFSLAINVDAVPAREKQQVPPPFQPLVQAKLADLTVKVGQEINIKAGLQYASADAATAAEKSAHDGIEMARQHLRDMKRDAGKPLMEPTTPSPAPLQELPDAAGAYAILALAGYYDELLDKLPLTREGSNLVLQAKLPAQAAPALPLAAMAGGMMLFWFAERPGMLAPRAVPAARIVPVAPAKAAPPKFEKAAPPKSVVPPPKSDGQ